MKKYFSNQTIVIHLAKFLGLVIICQFAFLFQVTSAATISSTSVNEVNALSGGEYSRCINAARNAGVSDAESSCLDSAITKIYEGYDNDMKLLAAMCPSKTGLNVNDLDSRAKCAYDPIGAIEEKLVGAERDSYTDCVVRTRNPEQCMLTVLGISSTPTNPVTVGEVTDPGDGGGVTDPGDGAGGKVTFKVDNPLKFKSISGLITAIIKLLIQIGLSIAVLFIVYAGFLYVTAAGNSEKVTKAHQVFLWAVIGTAVLLGSLVIMEVIQSTIRDVTTI